MECLEDTVAAVKSVQDTALVCSGLNRCSIAGSGEVTVELSRPGDQHPRYTITVADSPKARDTASMKFAAFIVPQGREREWVFGTPEGRQVLVENSGFDRLAVIRLHREHKYDSLKATQDETAETVLRLAPNTALRTATMFKLAILSLFFAVVSAGYPVAVAPAVSYAAPAVYHAPAVSYAAPAVSYAAPAVRYAAPAVYHAPAPVAYHAPAPVAYHAPAPVAYHAPAPVATSYANTYKVSNSVKAYAAPAYAAPAVYHAPAPVVRAYAAPAYAAHAYAAPAYAAPAYAAPAYAAHAYAAPAVYGAAYGYH